MGGQVQVYFGPITASFEAVFNQSSIFAGIMDLQGRLREVNNLAVDWCGYTGEQVLNRTTKGSPRWPGQNLLSPVSAPAHSQVIHFPQAALQVHDARENARLVENGFERCGT